MGTDAFPLPASGSEAETCDPAFQQQLASLEKRLLQGDFSGLAAFYATVSHDSPCFLLAARLVLLGTVGSGDTALFARVMEDVRTFPACCDVPLAQLGAELTEIWIRQFLNVTEGYPAWLVDGSLSHIPPEWRFLAAFLTARGFVLRREYVKAYAAAQMLLYLVPEMSSSPAGSAYLKFMLATSMQKEGRIEACEPLFREAVREAAEHGFLLMFLGMPLGFKSPLYKALKEVSPGLLRQVRRLSADFFRNKVRLHNFLTGEKLADCLSPREFEVASSLRHGLRYKEIADQLCVESVSINSITKSIYAKLGIHGLSELADKVW